METLDCKKRKIMSQRKFSIITINYNNKEGLRKTIESVVGQSFRDFEYIIIDGGSTDGSIEVIKEYAGKVDYWVSEPDKGIYHAMNKGVLQAHGEYLNFMNSGDEFYNNGVLQEVAPSLDSDIVVGKIVHGTEVWGFHKEDITLMDLIRGTVLHQASFFRKELFDENRYDESYKIVSDWKFYIQTLIFNNATFRNIRSIVCRFVPGGVSETDAGIRDMERKRVYKELFPDRMMKDYIRLEKVESPLLELIPELNKTAGLHQMAYKLVCALLWVHGKIKRVRVK
jgi:glycosyltransferase involved in cell wall biosynthesis